MTSSKVAERRTSVRVPSSYPVQVWDQRGRPIGRGKTGNISENGVFALLTPGGRSAAVGSMVKIEMDLPRSLGHPRLIRKVRYSARVIRLEMMGAWRGVGLELLDKLS